MSLVFRAICLAAIGIVVACGSTPNEASDGAARSGISIHGKDIRADNETAARAAEHARRMVGKPYRYGGNTPDGFDCSGLVHYSYSQTGLNVARTTQLQSKSGVAVSSTSLRAGDLVFFNQEGRKSSHVGIYLGNRRFVHAPSSGKTVRIDSLDTAYWLKHFASARRI